MNKPTDEPTKTKSIHGDAQPQAEAEDKDAKTTPVSHDHWMKPTAGDAQPQAGHTEGQDKSQKP